MDVYSWLESQPGLISASTLAKALGMPRSSVYALADAGRIPHFRMGHSLRFDPIKVAAWLRAREVKAAA